MTPIGNTNETVETEFEAGVQPKVQTLDLLDSKHMSLESLAASHSEQIEGRAAAGETTTITTATIVTTTTPITTTSTGKGDENN